MLTKVADSIEFRLHAHGKLAPCAKVKGANGQREREMKALLISIGVGVGLALWGAQPAGAYELAEGMRQLVIDPIYNILH